MSFQYDVLSEQEAMAERFQLLKEGEYDAVISESTDKVSANSGNPMMDMTIKVYDASGTAHEVRDFLVFTKKMMWKVVHFAESAGISRIYESGKLCSDNVINCRVKVKIGVEEGKEIPAEKLNGKPAGAKYSDKNKVEDYIKHSGSKSKVETVDEDEDVPF